MQKNKIGRLDARDIYTLKFFVGSNVVEVINDGNEYSVVIDGSGDIRFRFEDFQEIYENVLDIITSIRDSYSAAHKERRS